MSTAPEGGYTVGTLIGVPFLLIMLVIGIAIGIWLRKSWLKADRDLGTLFIGGTPLAILVLVIVFFWPLEKEYHYWTPVGGTVEKVDRRLVSEGKGMAEKIVIKFEDSPQSYGIEDTRAALLKPGDKTMLLCKRAHQWGPSVDGYDCRWGE